MRCRRATQRASDHRFAGVERGSEACGQIVREGTASQSTGPDQVSAVLSLVVSNERAEKGVRQDFAGRVSVDRFRCPSEQIRDESMGFGVLGTDRIQDGESKADIEDGQPWFGIVVEVGAHQFPRAAVEALTGVAAT